MQQTIKLACHTGANEIIQKQPMSSQEVGWAGRKKNQGDGIKSVYPGMLTSCHPCGRYCTCAYACICFKYTDLDLEVSIQECLALSWSVSMVMACVFFPPWIMSRVEYPGIFVGETFCWEQRQLLVY